jgi:hypothetical protein
MFRQIFENKDVLSLILVWSSEPNIHKLILSLCSSCVMELSKEILNDSYFWLRKLETTHVIKDKSPKDWKKYYDILTNKTGEKLIKIAPSDITLLKICLDNGFDPSVKYNFAIRWAAPNGHLDTVKLLLQDNRVDPSDGGNYAIQGAADNGHLEVVKLLLQDHRVDPSDNDNYAIRWAARNRHLEVVKLLLQNDRVDPNTMNNFAIRWAAHSGNLKVVKLLLQDHRVLNAISSKDKSYYKDLIKNIS